MALCSHHGGSVYISCSDNIRCGFGSHLCAWLRKEGITITNDEAFPAGTLTELARKNAIKKSNIVIIIISKEYLTSKHCLDELEMVLTYDGKKEILPVFYHIRSGDIGDQTGSFENVLKKVVEKTAYKVNIDRDESEIVQDITRDVSSKMKCVCSRDAQGLNDTILQPTTTHRTSLVPSVSDADALSLTHMLINVRKMLSCYNRTASTSSFSGVSHDVDQQTLAKDSVPSQSCLKRIRTALNTISDCLSHGFSVLQDFECLETLKGSLSYLSGLGPEEGISNEIKVDIELITDTFKHMQERFEAVENALDKACKLDFEKEQARYDYQQYCCRLRKLDAKKKILDEKETELEGKQLLLRNQLSDVQAKLQQSQDKGVGLSKERRRCYDVAKVEEEAMNKCCEELEKLQPSIDVAEKSKADVEATMEKFKNQAWLESLLAEIEKQLHGSNDRFHLP